MAEEQPRFSVTLRFDCESCDWSTDEASARDISMRDTAPDDQHFKETGHRNFMMIKQERMRSRVDGPAPRSGAHP